MNTHTFGLLFQTLLSPFLEKEPERKCEKRENTRKGEKRGEEERDGDVVTDNSFLVEKENC